MFASAVWARIKLRLAKTIIKKTIQTIVESKIFFNSFQPMQRLLYMGTFGEIIVYTLKTTKAKNKIPVTVPATSSLFLLSI